jgi:hypothetical protein
LRRITPHHRLLFFLLNAHHQTLSGICLTRSYELEVRGRGGSLGKGGRRAAREHRETPRAAGSDGRWPETGGRRRPRVGQIGAGDHGRGDGGHGRGGSVQATTGEAMAAQIGARRSRTGQWQPRSGHDRARPEQDWDEVGLNGGQIPSSRSIPRKKMMARILHRETWKLPE